MSDFNLQSLSFLFQNEQIYRLKSDFINDPVEDNQSVVPTAVVAENKAEIAQEQPKSEVVEPAVQLQTNEKKKVKLILLLPPISENLQQFLVKITAAIGILPEQYCQVHSFAEIANYDFEYLILFGIRHKKLDFPPYTITPFNKVKCLIADPLEVIEQDKALKQLLWTNLKAMFAV